jgi:hypothetical protein
MGCAERSQGGTGTMPISQAIRVGVAFGTLLLAGCSLNLFSPPENTASTGCVDDSKECIDRRAAALRGMMADKDRRWVREPASPESYASGVRLFAYKSRKRDLSCDELAHGRREADAAPVSLRGPAAAGLTPAQISRGSMLAAEVSRELAAEMKRRCKA